MKKFYITTAITYVNAPPHIGHALEFIQADVIARYRREIGDSVFFSTGSDEHGVKIARRAEELNTTSQALVDENAQKLRDLKKPLDLSWDVFVRTSDRKRHWPVAQRVWNALYEAGDLYRKIYEGLYCAGCEAFITKKDLENGKCVIHKTEPEIIKEENWFFRLSKYSDRIREILEKGEVRIVPESRKNEILSLIKEGAEDVSFSRPAKDLSWGVPVPGDETQTMYVWADALANYISALSWDGDEKRQKEYWPPDVHVIGKDILRFHALIWIGMLLSAKMKLPKEIFVHGFVTSGGEKMSKSLGNVINPVELVGKYGTDALRYYLLREIPSTEDGDISIEKFQARYNGDLANGLGNLVSRVATLGEKVSPLPFAKRSIDTTLKESARMHAGKYTTYMEEHRFNEALSEAWQLIGVADRYVNDMAPWKITDSEKLADVIGNASFLILEIATLLSPFLPSTVEKVRRQFSLAEDVLSIRKKEGLFPRLS